MYGGEEKLLRDISRLLVVASPPARPRRRKADALYFYNICHTGLAAMYRRAWFLDLAPFTAGSFSPCNGSLGRRLGHINFELATKISRPRYNRRHAP